MKLLALVAAPLALIAGLLGGVVLIGGDATPPAIGLCGGVPGDLAVILDTIRTQESSGDYTARANGSTASGAYQFLDTTWANYGGYPRAYLAPPAIQDAKATEWVTGILAQNAGAIESIPVTWYIGHIPPAGSSEWDTVPYPGQGNTITPRQYVDRWMAIYATKVAAAPTTMVGGLPATASIVDSVASDPPVAATLSPGLSDSAALPGSSPTPTYASASSTAIPLVGGSTTSLAAGPAANPPAAGCQVPVNADGYALPVARELIDPNPALLSVPHHDYPAWDYPTPIGTPIYAMHAGTVTRITKGPQNCYPGGLNCDKCGLGVVITDTNATEWTYCHASQTLVLEGMPIAPGQRIMTSGNSGYSTGPHLHLGIRVGGVDVCPQPVLAAIHSSRLPLTLRPPQWNRGCVEGPLP